MVLRYHGVLIRHIKKEPERHDHHTTEGASPMSTPPVRLTRRRAQALLDIFGRGLDEERASIEDTYGVYFMSDGTLEIEAEDLLEPGELEDLTSRLGRLTDALAASRIIRRRYA